jgi:hypothetical protein
MRMVSSKAVFVRKAKEIKINILSTVLTQLGRVLFDNCRPKISFSVLRNYVICEEGYLLVCSAV